MTKSRRLALMFLVGASSAALAGCASGATPGGESVDPQDYVGATFASTEQGEPYLTFADDGTYSGSDGCNGLNGTYEVEGEELLLEPGLMTQKACPDIDTWLHNAAQVQLDGDTLIVYDAADAEIGSLSRS
ncbi:META domain-containing protein [Microbacterium suaedae]|uniref:META domain-containing protein n=1 Tax=Microbacterium suaedae TaxID=2067813 RepID=UPI000DA1F1BE|nr:META domain-containing protein [Microbacterium suaedae]